jgi:four helix bundle protein
MKVERFEALEAWQQARQLTRMVYDLTEIDGFSRDFRLRDQITGAAVSVMNNIVEGFTSQSDREFIKFLGYARRSTAEVQTCLYVSLDRRYVHTPAFQQTYEQAEKTRKIIDGFLRYLRSQRPRPTKRTRRP